jgi:hypothetical protein
MTDACQKMRYARVSISAAGFFSFFNVDFGGQLAIFTGSLAKI